MIFFLSYRFPFINFLVHPCMAWSPFWAIIGPELLFGQKVHYKFLRSTKSPNSPLMYFTMPLCFPLIKSNSNLMLLLAKKIKSHCPVHSTAEKVLPNGGRAIKPPFTSMLCIHWSILPHSHKFWHHLLLYGNSLNNFLASQS